VSMCTDRTLDTVTEQDGHMARIPFAARQALLFILVAMLAGALLGFALSIDDFVITYFVSGPTQTFPLYVWGIARVSVPPQVNVVASPIFVGAIAIALGNVLWQYPRPKRTQECK